MSDAAETRSLVVEREMPHPPEKGWRALTEASLLQKWLMENDFAPVVGHAFNFRATPMPHWNGVVGCEVLVIEPCDGCPTPGILRRRGSGGPPDCRHRG